MRSWVLRSGALAIDAGKQRIRSIRWAYNHSSKNESLADKTFTGKGNVLTSNQARNELPKIIANRIYYCLCPTSGVGSRQADD